MTDVDLRAPFPWFGGKSRRAAEIWKAIGPDVPNYVEPFGATLAILLGRPGGPGKIETVNDLDCDVENFWRAIRYDPYGVAAWCDDPVNEAAMHAEHEHLVATLPAHRERMHREKYYCDVERAGRWVFGICMWIGTGWCQSTKQQIPSLRVDAGNGGMGVHRSGLAQKIPDLAVKADGACAGRKIHSEASVAAYTKQQMPDLAIAARAQHGGRGIHSSTALGNLPSLGNDRGINGLSAPIGTTQHTLGVLSVPDGPPCFEWFKALALRLRRVRIACGDFERVLGRSILGKGKNVGGRRPCAIVLDPPYDPDRRTKSIYREDAAEVAGRARTWAIENGDDRELRIALCGYAGMEMPASWTEHRWTGSRGYASESNDNRELETIWFSPGCVQEQRTMSELFDRLR